MDKAKFIEAVEKMSVLELSELVKSLEEKFGVSASMPIAVGAMPMGVDIGTEDAAKIEEKTSFTVELTNAGAQKINVIKVMREVTQLGLKEAKDLADGAPKVIKENVSKEEAEEIKRKLEAAGATVVLR